MKMNVWGGSAAGGGLNFQACVSAIAAVHLARGTPIGWLKDVTADVPIFLLAETGGPGDDIRLEFQNGSTAEIQSKRRIHLGPKFWESLLNLATAINSCKISYGILIVCPNSSGTIRDQLARDVIRLGQGRQDSLSSSGQQLKDLLASKSLDVERVCAGLRIVTVHALNTDSASVSAAWAELAHLCTDVQSAWDHLYLDAHSLIEFRGRRTAVNILQLLRSAGIKLREDATASPVALLQRLSAWVERSNDRFSVFGITKPLPLETSWIDLKAMVQEEEPISDDNLANALVRYHSWDSRSDQRDSKKIDAETLGQFIKRCVVIAGPGMGKTTLLKRLARVYAKEGYPVLRVSLNNVATRIETSGQGVEESILDLGLDGSGIGAKDLRLINLQNLVLLCDGLDECGHLQDTVAQGLLNLAAGYPHCRIISTTRPIGYDTSLLRLWRHYELLPLDPYSARQHISKILRGILDEESEKFKNTLTFAEAQLTLDHVKKVASRSPMLLGFIASLSLKSVSAGTSRADLYRQLFTLIEEAPNTRSGDDRDPGNAFMVTFLEIIGWNLLAHPYETLIDTLERCARNIAPELGQTLLCAKDTCHRCARRWEDLGMLEQVCFQTDKGITFVHKTFGEYAAARRLTKLDPLQQDAAFRLHVTDGAWAETIKFACSMGLAEKAISATLAKIENDDLRVDILEGAFEYLNESTEQVQKEVTDNLFDRAWECVLSPYRSLALHAGSELAKIAPKYPAVSSRASRELAHHQPWTKLTAWACVCGVNPEYFNYHDLLHMLKEITSADYRYKRLLPKGLMLGDPMTELVGSFILSAAREILRHGPGAKDLAVLQAVLDQDVGQASSLFSEITALLEPYGWHSHKSYLTKAKDWYPSQEYWRNQRDEHIALLEALDVPAAKVSIDEQPADDGVMMYFSGFINASQYWRISDNHVLLWPSEGKVDIAKEVLQAFATISGVERNRLASDVRLLLAMLKAETDDMAIFHVYDRLVHVDATPAWEQAKKLSISIDTLEQAMLHRSYWIVMLASNLLENKASKEQLYPILDRLLNKGIETSLWAAAQMIKELESSDAIDLIRKRLLKPISKGCDYLFKTLGELSSSCEDSETLQALRNGLLCKYPKITIEAAKFAGKVAATLQADLKGTLWESYRYWQINEGPYPTSSGRIPDSPRADIIKVILLVAEIEDAELINMMADPRSDVREASHKALFDRLVKSEGFRDRFLTAVLEKKLTLLLLDEALKNKIPFSLHQCTTIRDMLDDEDPKKRYASMMVLSDPYSTAEESQRYVKQLLGDEEAEIREKARDILNSWCKQRI